MGRLVAKKTRDNVMPATLKALFVAWMVGVAWATLGYLPPAGAFADPESARMIVFHVPCAMVSVIAYLVSTVYAIRYLAGRKREADAKSAASAELGLVFTVLATVSGMVFAQIQWGSAWNWDPRETSILMLMLVYSAYFALRASLPGSARARISAAYNVLACVVMPYLVFVLPRIVGGLHPSNTLSDRGSLSTEYRIVLFASMIGFVWLYVWLMRLRVQALEARAGGFVR